MEMGFKAFLIVMISAVVVTPALATDYLVGDNEGWKLGVNYTNWAHGKDFRVGDTIMFMYNNNTHNVMKVSGSDFKSCVNTNASSPPYKSGWDTFTLSSPGKKWYICGVEGHCNQGMKLVITVSSLGPEPAPSPVPGSPNVPAPSPVLGSVNGPSPSPAPGSPNNSLASELSPTKSFMWILGLVAAYKMIFYVA